MGIAFTMKPIVLKSNALNKINKSKSIQTKFTNPESPGERLATFIRLTSGVLLITQTINVMLTWKTEIMVISVMYL